MSKGEMGGEVLARSSDYKVIIECRFDYEDSGWSVYQDVSDFPVDQSLERVERYNREHSENPDPLRRMFFRLTGTRVDTVKELLT